LATRSGSIADVTAIIEKRGTNRKPIGSAPSPSKA